MLRARQFCSQLIHVSANKRLSLWRRHCMCLFFQKWRKTQSHCKGTSENAALLRGRYTVWKAAELIFESIFPPSKGSAAILAKRTLVSQWLTLSRGRKGWEVTGLTTCRMPGALLSSRSDHYQTLNHCSSTQDSNLMLASLSQER